MSVGYKFPWFLDDFEVFDVHKIITVIDRLKAKSVLAIG